MKNAQSLATALALAIAASGGYFVGSLKRPAPAPANSAQADDSRPSSIQNEGLEAEGTTGDYPTPTGEHDGSVDSYSGSQPQVLFQKIQEAPPSPAKRRQLEAFFRKWGELRGSDAYDYASKLTGRDRISCMAQAAAGWASTEPKEAWKKIMLDTNNGASDNPTLDPVVKEIARNDLVLAVELLQQVRDPENAQDQFRSISHIVSESGNYLELLGAVNSVHEPGSKARLTEMLFEEWGQYDLNEPLKALETLDDSEIAASALSGLMQGWAQIDGEAAFNYALQNGSDRTMSDLLGKIAQHWARTSTNDEIGTIIELVSSIDDSDRILPEVAVPLVERQPQATLEAIARIENTNARAMSTAAAMRSWAQFDYDDAASYYSSMDYGQSKQQAFWSLFNIGMRAGDSTDRIVDLAFELDSPNAVHSSLVSMAEYTNVSPYKSQSESLAASIRRVIES